MSVVAAINILIPLKDTSAVEGTKVVLETKISAQDISSIKWYQNDKLLMPSDRIQMVTKGAKQRLVFNRTYASDEGHYKLVVGRADTSCRLSVQSKLNQLDRVKHLSTCKPFNRSNTSHNDNNAIYSAGAYRDKVRNKRTLASFGSFQIHSKPNMEIVF